jgi:hypothetical protein
VKYVSCWMARFYDYKCNDIVGIHQWIFMTRDFYFRPLKLGMGLKTFLHQYATFAIIWEFIFFVGLGVLSL